MDWAVDWTVDRTIESVHRVGGSKERAVLYSYSTGVLYLPVKVLYLPVNSAVFAQPQC